MSVCSGTKQGHRHSRCFLVGGLGLQLCCGPCHLLLFGTPPFFPALTCGFLGNFLAALRCQFGCTGIAAFTCSKAAKRNGVAILFPSHFRQTQMSLLAPLPHLWWWPDMVATRSAPSNVGRHDYNI